MALSGNSPKQSAQAARCVTRSTRFVWNFGGSAAAGLAVGFGKPRAFRTLIRKTAAERLAKIDAAAEISFPKLRAAREAAIAKATAAEIEWHKACHVAQQAQRDLSSASYTQSNELQKLEAQLIETASPEIAIFLSDMRDEWEKCFKQFAFHTAAETVNRITGKKASVTVNNRASVMARQTAIRDAQAAAEAMRLEPDQSTVSAWLQELRNNLPAIAGL
jgi:hypothetical protein